MIVTWENSQEFESEGRCVGKYVFLVLLVLLVLLVWLVLLVLIVLLVFLPPVPCVCASVPVRACCRPPG